jgi:hypothetical protein
VGPEWWILTLRAIGELNAYDETYPEQIRTQARSWKEYCLMPEERDHVVEAQAWLLSIGTSLRHPIGSIRQRGG